MRIRSSPETASPGMGRRRIPMIGLLAVVLSLGGLAVATVPAAAATHAHAAYSAAHASHASIPLDSSPCNGDVCMYLSTPSSHGYVYIQACANNTTFYGHFQLVGPGVDKYTGNQSWYPGYGYCAGSTNYYQWSGVKAIVGQYCVTGKTPQGQVLGHPCASIE